jgi:hypothetical protein
MGLRNWSRCGCAAGLAVLSVVSGMPAFSQAAAIAPAQAAPTTLHIEILEGEGALNNIRQRDAREPVVQITDENHKPVSSVAVLFLIHSGSGGAGATFGGQSLAFTATTGPDGIARATSMQLAKSPGSFTIGVTASLGSVVATSVIHESSVLTALSSTAAGSAAGAAGSSTGATIATHTILGMSKLVFVAVGSAVVAGVVVGVVEGTKSSGTSLTLGQGTISASVPGARGAGK